MIIVFTIHMNVSYAQHSFVVAYHSVSISFIQLDLITTVLINVPPNLPGHR